MSIIYDCNNNISINTSTKQGRLNFGLKKEISFLDLLHQNDLIDFISNDNSTDEVYNWTDYKFCNDKVNVFLELKNRTNKISTYPTTIFAKNKVKSYKEHKEDNKKNYYFVIFGYLNDNKETDYYYIKYSKSFNEYSEKNVFNKLHYEIPVNDLLPIQNLFKILHSIINSNR